MQKKAFINFHTRFSSGEDREAEAAAQEALEISPGQQQSQVDLLTLHPDGTKQGRRCDHSTWTLVILRAAFLWVKPEGLATPILSGIFCTHRRKNSWDPSIGKISGPTLRALLISQLRTLSRCFTSWNPLKIPYLPLALEIVLLKSLPNMLDHKEGLEQRLI